MIKIRNLSRTYGGETPLTVLRSIELDIKEGEFVAITGPSGSGKSTLMGLMAGLDKPTSGSVLFDDVDITVLSENDLARLRGEKVGFIFQNFLLMQTLTALENVALPAEIVGKPNAMESARELLSSVGLLERAGHYPTQLSGGEMQRVAIARAFVNYPPILFADEPTGNLDSHNGANIVKLLLSLNKKHKSTLILITHNPELAELADREVRLMDGEIREIVYHKKNSQNGSGKIKATVKVASRAGKSGKVRAKKRK